MLHLGYGSGSASKNLSIFNLNIFYWAFGSMIRDVHLDPNFFPSRTTDPDPGVKNSTGSWIRIQGSKKHRIPDRIRNTEKHWRLYTKFRQFNWYRFRTISSLFWLDPLFNVSSLNCAETEIRGIQDDRWISEKPQLPQSKTSIQHLPPSRSSLISH